MKFCPKCGKEINEGADICLGCGVVLKQAVKTTKPDNLATTGFILSLIGFWVFGIPLGTAAIICSAMGLKKASESKTSKGFAIAGLVIGIIDVVGAILVII